MSQKKNTTIADIAEELDVNISIVSRALKDHPGISDETKDKVIQTAKRLNYYPNNIVYRAVEHLLKQGCENIVQE